MAPFMVAIKEAIKPLHDASGETIAHIPVSTSLRCRIKLPTEALSLFLSLSISHAHTLALNLLVLKPYCRRDRASELHMVQPRSWVAFPLYFVNSSCESLFTGGFSLSSLPPLIASHRGALPDIENPSFEFVVTNASSLSLPFHFWCSKSPFWQGAAFVGQGATVGDIA
jgi:hypothetical protein